MDDLSEFFARYSLVLCFNLPGREYHLGLAGHARDLLCACVARNAQKFVRVAPEAHAVAFGIRDAGHKSNL